LHSSPDVFETYESIYATLGNNLLGRKKASLRMLHELNFTGWLIKISFSPSMAAAWVAADEEQRHPFFPPRGGLQYSRNQGSENL
jgi:hypothetical protein